MNRYIGHFWITLSSAVDFQITVANSSVTRNAQDVLATVIADIAEDLIKIKDS